MSPQDIKDIAEWLVSDDCGVSSKTMAAIALGADKGRLNAPHDPSDFGRCYRLVKKVPAIRTAFDRIGEIEPRFAGILLNWDELCSLYERDLHTGQSKELYLRIKALRGDTK